MCFDFPPFSAILTLMISLIVFLGNPGVQYAGNRHNVAWQFADSLDTVRALVWQMKFHGNTASLSDVRLLKPNTYMNLSGMSAGALMRFYKIQPEETLIVHDELELPLGKVSLKWSGGLGGHNGLRSMEAVLNTRDFWRLRFGIGRPEHLDIANYVLSDFSASEAETIRTVFTQTEALFTLLLSQEPDTLLAEWGKKQCAP
jgi:PTH1 family peptidyl-tRNA hydrolase